MITGVHHTSFTVSNLDRALAFYHDLLDMEILNYRPEATAPYLAQVTGFPSVRLRVALLRPAPQSTHLLELIEYVEPVGAPADVRTCNPGSTHLCVTTDNIYPLYRRLAQAGVTFRSPPVPLPTGPNAGGFSTYCLDPDGITIEIFQPPFTTASPASA